jgi:hypothetical protein
MKKQRRAIKKNIDRIMAQPTILTSTFTIYESCKSIKN